MTLNVTVFAPRIAFQCADFRFTDIATGEPTDLAENQKIFFLQRAGWHATVCFNGVGRFGSTNVSSWLGAKLGELDQSDRIEKLFDKLKSADSWLSAIPPPYNRHTFVVGAFNGSRPIYALVSNYEEVRAPPAAIANGKLEISVCEPIGSRVFVSGQPTALSRESRRRLMNIAQVEGARQRTLEMLAEMNAAAARLNNTIGPGCFAQYVTRSGEAGGGPHGILVQTGPLTHPASMEYGGAIRELLDGKFGAGKWQMRQFAAGRSEPTDDYHSTRLKDHPLDPNTYVNYGAYLQDKKKDQKGARDAYCRALELDPKCVIALSNLANLTALQGNRVEAESLYEKALSIDPKNELASFGYASWLLRHSYRLDVAHKIATTAAEKNESSGRLALLAGQLALRNKDGDSARVAFESARQRGANQSEVEAGFAVALHLSTADPGAKIDAYRTALALNKSDSSLMVNLGQLLLASGYEEGGELVERAIKGALDDAVRIEAWFYVLAHKPREATIALTELIALAEKGARLDWDVSANVERVRRLDVRWAVVVEQVEKALSSCDVETLRSLKFT